MSFGKRQIRPAAGNLRNPFKLFTEVRTDNGRGGWTIAWQEAAATYWSMPMPPIRRSKSVFRDGQEQHLQVYQFCCRRDGTLNTKLADQYRLLYDGEYYEVFGVSNYEFRRDFYLIEAVRWGGTATPTILTPP